MTKRIIEDSFKNTQMGDNANIQGDYVHQEKITNQALPPKIFEELIKNINENVPKGEDKEQALQFAEEIKESVKKNDYQKAKKYAKWLGNILQASSALATIIAFLQNIH